MFPSTSYQTTRGDGTGQNSRSEKPSVPLQKEPSFPESARGEKKQGKPASKKTEIAPNRTKEPHTAWNPFGSDSLPKSPTAGASSKDTSSGTFWDQHG